MSVKQSQPSKPSKPTKHRKSLRTGIRAGDIYMQYPRGSNGGGG
jgi:hypothetical protein